jgi:hypothetical protein
VAEEQTLPADAGAGGWRLVIGSRWSQPPSECQRLRHPPRLNHRGWRLALPSLRLRSARPKAVLAAEQRLRSIGSSRAAAAAAGGGGGVHLASGGAAALPLEQALGESSLWRRHIARVRTCWVN